MNEISPPKERKQSKTTKPNAHNIIWGIWSPRKEKTPAERNKKAEKKDASKQNDYYELGISPAMAREIPQQQEGKKAKGEDLHQHKAGG